MLAEKLIKHIRQLLQVQQQGECLIHRTQLIRKIITRAIDIEEPQFRPLNQPTQGLAVLNQEDIQIQPIHQAIAHQALLQDNLIMKITAAVSIQHLRGVHLIQEAVILLHQITLVPTQLHGEVKVLHHLHTTIVAEGLLHLTILLQDRQVVVLHQEAAQVEVHTQAGAVAHIPAEAAAAALQAAAVAAVDAEDKSTT